MSTYIRLLASYSPYIANQKDCVCVLTYVRLADIRGFAINFSLSHLQPAAVTEECCAACMTAASRPTRRRILAAQTNATTDSASQCFSRHKRETLLSKYFLSQISHAACQVPSPMTLTEDGPFR